MPQTGNVYGPSDSVCQTWCVIWASRLRLATDVNSFQLRGPNSELRTKSKPSGKFCFVPIKYGNPRSTEEGIRIAYTIRKILVEQRGKSGTGLYIKHLRKLDIYNKKTCLTKDFIMGNGQASSRGSMEYESAARTFSQLELERLKKVYISLAAQSRSEGQYISASTFQAYFGIRGSLGTRLFDLVTQNRKDQRLYFEDMIIAKATYEKGSPSEIEDFMFQLLDLTGDGKVPRTEVESVMLSILLTVLGSKDGTANASVPEESLQAFLNAAEYSVKSESEAEPCMSKKDFQKLCTLIPAVKRSLASLLVPPHAGPMGRQIPNLIVPEALRCSTLLRDEYAWHICGTLQQHEAQEWILLYHSSMHGLSFNTFLANVTGLHCPTVLVIKDKEGCIYGGYASQPLEKHPDFYGDMKCFPFTLRPRVSLYRPTGSNSNLQWCAYNYISESIPNGIGFGGQINHFGLFLSGSFDRGHTRYSVTFGNPPLSTKEDFIPETIECWGVVLKGDHDENTEKMKGTILERFKEDRQMLNMMGIANASDSVGQV